jgi:hypothetical protein
VDTPEDAYEAAVAHLTAARKMLARPAAQGRALAKSGSPHGSKEGEEARKKAERLRSQVTRIIAEVRALEEELHRAQTWHNGYERVKRMG